ncbi:hypothetical protein Tco_0763441 [Tanacetum coccineum]
MFVHNSEHNTPNNSDHDDDIHDSITRINKLDISDPLHLHPNDTTVFTVVSIKLKGTENYQYDVMIELPKCVCNASEGFKKHNQLLKLMQFIMGLDDSYMLIRSSILSRETLPDVRSVYATISSEKSHRVVVGSIVGSSQKNQASAFVQGEGSDLNNNKASGGSGLVCENCGFNGHTIDRCFKIIGYPADFGKKKSGQNFKKQSVSNNNSVRKSQYDRVPHHSLDLWSLTQFFYDHVDDYTQMDLDFAADGNLRELSGEEAWETIENFAHGQKEWDNPPNIISEQEIENLKVHAKRLFGNENVWVEMHRKIAWDKVENPNPQSTSQVPPSFEETTPPVTHLEDVDETIGIPTEVEPLDETQLKDLGLNTCNHDIPLSSREIPSFDEPEPQLLPNFSPLYVNLGDKRGTDPIIKPHSPDSFRMKVVDPLTIHTPPLPHVASFRPKDKSCYYHPCVDDPKKHYGFKPGLLGKSGSLSVDF